MKTTSPTTPHTATVTQRARHLAAAMLIVLTATLGASYAQAQPANATAWDPVVNLHGRALIGACKATWVWVQASNGERGWATRPGGNYQFTFKRVPAIKGMNVTVKVGCNNITRTTTFGVKRPTAGRNAARNVQFLY